MKLIQDCANSVYPKEEEIEGVIEFLNNLLPQYKHTVCNGAVGDWRMMPNGSTCFYCPPIYLPEDNTPPRV